MRLFTLVLALVALTSPAESQVRTAMDSVRRLDSLYAAAYATHDTVFARQIFADDFVMTAGNGMMKDREAELGDIRPAAGIVVTYFRSADVNVRLHGSTAVVTGRLEWVLGNRPEIRRRYTATWARGGVHGWRMVALHVGPSP